MCYVAVCSLREVSTIVASSYITIQGREGIVCVFLYDSLRQGKWLFCVEEGKGKRSIVPEFRELATLFCFFPGDTSTFD